jgi:hypothetical protein
MGIKTIIIANNHEYYAPLDVCLSSATQKILQQGDADVASRVLFWEDDDKLVVLPKPIDTEWLIDIQQIMRYKNLTIRWPKNYTGMLCKDILSDSDLLEFICDNISVSKGSSLISWGATKGLQELSSYLLCRDLIFQVPSLPNPDCFWTIDFFGTKAGFRQLGASLVNRGAPIKLPDGWICSNVQESTYFINNFLATERSVILKPNRSCGGWGTVVLQAEQFDSVSEISLSELIHNQVEDFGAITTEGSMIVEEYISPSFYKNSYHLIPSVDAFIDHDGQTHCKIIGNMIIKDLTHYHGIVLGNDILPSQVADRLKKIATIIGNGLAEHGYRGWFDIDLVADSEQELYCTEINTRRTASIYAFNIFTKLKGYYPGQIKVALANDGWNVDAFQGLSYKDVKSALKSVLFPIENKPCGMVITMASPLLDGRGMIGFVIVGASLKDIMEIERKAEVLTR